MKRTAILLAVLLLGAAPAKKETADLLMTGGTVVTVDGKFSVFSPGAVAVSDGRILAVGPAAEIGGRYAAREEQSAR